jgi:hypothetical protein
MTPNPYLTRAHIEAQRGEARPEVAEQAARSLALVAALSKTGLPFRFKGGNSLLLILQSLERFSIDVDISTGEPRERIEACLDAAVKESGAFTRWARRQHKTKPWLPLASFEVYYDSVFPGAEGTFLFFDAQLHETRYAGQRVAVRCGELFASEATAEVATPGGILGDKLLTLGPFTYGIPLGKNKEAQRLKHAFDAARLSRAGPDLREVRESLAFCREQEDELQGRSHSMEESLLDTLRLCACPMPFAAPPAPESVEPTLAEVVRGLAPFREHLFTRRYGWAELQRDFACAAVCMAAVATKGVSGGDFSAALRAAPGGAVPGRFPHNPEAAAKWEAVGRWTGLAMDEILAPPVDRRDGSRFRAGNAGKGPSGGKS